MDGSPDDSASTRAALHLHDVVDIYAVALTAAEKRCQDSLKMERVQDLASALLKTLEGNRLEERIAALQAVLRPCEESLRDLARNAAHQLRAI